MLRISKHELPHVTQIGTHQFAANLERLKDAQPEQLRILISHHNDTGRPQAWIAYRDAHWPIAYTTEGCDPEVLRVELQVVFGVPVPVRSYWDHPEYYHPRGAGGGDGSGHCFICMDEHVSGKDMAGFVSSREGGLNVVEMFGGPKRARLDYRAFEPDWVQVKIATCRDHDWKIDYLYLLTQQSGCLKLSTMNTVFELEPGDYRRVLENEVEYGGWNVSYARHLLETLDESKAA